MNNVMKTAFGNSSILSQIKKETISADNNLGAPAAGLSGRIFLGEQWHCFNVSQSRTKKGYLPPIPRAAHVYCLPSGE